MRIVRDIAIPLIGTVALLSLMILLGIPVNSPIGILVGISSVALLIVAIYYALKYEKKEIVSVIGISLLATLVNPVYSIMLLSLPSMFLSEYNIKNREFIKMLSMSGLFLGMLSLLFQVPFMWLAVLLILSGYLLLL